MKIDPKRQMIDYSEADVLSIGAAGEGFKAIRVTEVTGDMASINDGADGGLELAVVGAAVGDVVLGVSVGVDLGDQVILQGSVTEAGKVYVTLFNRSGGAVDLASTTYTIVWLDKA